MRDFSGLLKMAFWPQPNQPAPQPQTVGDFMHSWSANLNANPAVRRDAFDRINAAGLDVKQPASRIPYILGGGIAGRAAASYLGAGPFLKNVATVRGALFGNSLYKKHNPDPRNMPYAPGVVYRGF